jgi:hypothetical protein
MDELLVVDSDADELLLWGLDCVANQLVLLSRTVAVIAWQFDDAALAHVSTDLMQDIALVPRAREQLSDQRPSRAGRPSVRVGWGQAKTTYPT